MVTLERTLATLSPEFKSQLCHQPGVCLRESHLYFLSLYFLALKEGTLTS